MYNKQMQLITELPTHLFIPGLILNELILFIELNTSNVELPLKSGVDEVIFSVWDTLLTVDLQDLSWVSFHVNELKIIAQMEFSNHLEARLTVVKEIRVKMNQNEVCSFILGKQFGTPQKIFSILQLKTFIKNFQSLTICCNILPSVYYNNVQTMKKGYINILNCWQSVECKRQIEDSNGNICSNCLLLRISLTSKVSRYVNIFLKIN